MDVDVDVNVEAERMMQSKNILEAEALDISTLDGVEAKCQGPSSTSS